MTPIEQLSQVLPTITELVEGIQPSQLDEPTPCSKFTVHDVLDHMIVLGGGFAYHFRGEDAPEITGAAITAFDVEVLYLALRKGYRVKDVPVEWHYGEHSKVNPIKDSWRNFCDVVNVRLNALRGHYD